MLTTVDPVSLLLTVGSWLALFLAPFIIVLVAAELGFAEKNGNCHWIYKPIRFRVCQRVPAFVHAAWLTYLGFLDFKEHNYTFNLLDRNTQFQEQVLQLSLGYLIADTLLDLYRGPELLYFIHHFTLILGFSSSIYFTRKVAATVISMCFFQL
jgi:hypothetical protein